MLLKFKALHLFSHNREHTARLMIEGIGELETKVVLSDKVMKMIEDEVLEAFCNSERGNVLGKALSNGKALA